MKNFFFFFFFKQFILIFVSFLRVKITNNQTVANYKKNIRFSIFHLKKSKLLMYFCTLKKELPHFWNKISEKFEKKRKNITLNQPKINRYEKDKSWY